MSFVALETATGRYIASRRAKVDAFCAAQFNTRTTVLRLRETVMKDIWRHLFNFVFAIPSLFARKVGGWLEKLGWDQPAKRLLDLPLSLKPRAEHRIEALIMSDLLGIQGATDTSHDYARFVFESEELRALAPLHPAVRRIASAQHFLERADGPLKDFANSRWTIFQALSSAMLLLAARVLFGEAGFDFYAIGNKVARNHARDDKSSRFFLGEKAGNFFYGIFPPDPTPFQVFSSIALLITGAACGAVILSAILEPLQLVGGVQKRQLHKLLDRLDWELMGAIRKDALSLGLVGLSATPVELPTAPVQLVEEKTEPSEPRWFARATEDMTARMKDLQTKYGRRRITLVAGIGVLVLSLLAVFISNKMRFDPYKEVRELCEAGAYPTALSRLDDLAKVKGYTAHSDYWFWRGRAYAGQKSYDASADAHRQALKRNVVHRENDVLIADLVDAVAHGSAKAKTVLLQEIGPGAVTVLAERARKEERIDRWALVETAEKLGGKDELDYEDIAEMDLEQTQTCAEKKRAVQEISERRISGVTDELKKLEGQAEMKCLQETLKTALVNLGR